MRLSKAKKTSAFGHFCIVCLMQIKNGRGKLCLDWVQFAHPIFILSVVNFSLTSLRIYAHIC